MCHGDVTSLKKIMCGKNKTTYLQYCLKRGNGLFIQFCDSNHEITQMQQEEKE